MLLYSDTPMSPLPRTLVHVNYGMGDGRQGSTYAYYIPMAVSGPARSERNVKVSDQAPSLAPDLTLYE